ncbi:MAG TPA: hypothetical protein VKI44_09720 [Acetobacteraceae bacterium]|nr:hypothetical protein [Acetobacteraceae bacterium]
MRSTHYLPRLPATVAGVLLERLRSALPAPIPDTPENRATRDHDAFAAVAALRPANAADALFATMIVAEQAHASECLRMAGLMRQDSGMADRYRTLGNRMMRESLSSLDLLRTCQAGAAGQAASPPPAASPPAGPLRDVSLPTQGEAPRPAAQPATDARQQRAARIRALDLRVIETPPTRH